MGGQAMTHRVGCGCRRNEAITQRVFQRDVCMKLIDAVDCRCVGRQARFLQGSAERLGAVILKGARSITA